MARIELRNCTVRVKDGFAGTAKVNQPSPAPADGNSTLVIDTLAGLTEGGTVVPVGARFSVVGSTQERYAISAVNSNEQVSVTLAYAGGGTFTLSFGGQTTAPIAYNAVGATVETAFEALTSVGAGNGTVTGSAGGPYTVEFTGTLAATNVGAVTASAASLTPVQATVGVAETVKGSVDPAVNEQQTVTITGVTGGTFTLTYVDQTTSALAYNISSAALATALKALSNIEDADVAVSGDAGGPYVVTFQGALAATDVAMLVAVATDLTEPAATVTPAVVHPGATTWRLTFTPLLATADGIPADDAVITLLPQQIDIKIGDGEVKFTEANEYKYDKDRGELDTVREGDDVPMDVSLNFTFEHVKTGTAEAITPVDAIKGINGAAGWFSSSSDDCEPYSVDIEIVHEPPCGAVEAETIIFPDFRSDKRDYDFKNAAIAVTGKCNAVEPVITRS